jgi:hypothetical protein
MNHQQVRPSQFITTYGPGSILETRSGPVVTLSMERVFTDNALVLQDFEIRDSRLSRDPAINGAGIVRLPSNAEVMREEQFPLYATDGLPYWSLCVSHRILYWARTGCPGCPPLRNARAVREKAGREAIRFVRACAAGHLDDVDWNFVVHGGVACGRQPGYYLWVGGGSSLRNVEIRCPPGRAGGCGAQVNFGTAYSRDWRCAERFAERGPRPAQSTCALPARIVQRGAANLRTPVVVSALTIPPIASRLHNLLQDSRLMTFCSTLIGINLLTETNFRQGLNTIQPPLGASVLQFLQTRSWADIQQAIRDVSTQLAATGRTLKEDEFGSLRFAAVNGAPAIPAPQLGVPPLFEVRAGDVRRFPGPARRRTFRVVPVSRLRMVLVQTAYRRLDPIAGAPVSVAFQVGGRQWYPGVELFGEGVFIDVPDADLDLVGDRAAAWAASYQQSNGPDETLHPVHVWWHTLSHRLLRALSVDSGYSSASIRERVYLRLEPGQPPQGGLLLYTVQPGGDGTLGGLIGLTPSFGQVIASALSELASCSNDPLCEEAVPDGVNGSACYSCLLASETSCEQRNVHLDRVLLLENLP